MRRIDWQHSVLFVSVLWYLLLVPGARANEADYQRLAASIEQEAENKGLPLLSIVLVDEGGIVWSHGVTTNAAAAATIADGDTTYRIGSVSKLFTDIVVMQMVEKGDLDLDAPVAGYIADFHPNNPFDEPITLRALMSHSSGLVREPPVGNYFETSEPTLEQTVTSLNDTTLVYAPGSKVQYSNAGIAVVGRVLEVVAGRPFADVLENSVLLPLGMKHSAFLPIEEVTRKLPEAWMWSYQGDRTIAPTFELGMSPAGSMYSSMNDLALFMGALIKKGEGRDGRILSEAGLTEMWTPQSAIKSGRDRSFGIGFSLGAMDGEFSVSHGGAIYGFATQLKVLPERKIGVAISTNLDMANGAAGRIADHALRTLLAIKEGRPVPTLQISSPVTEELAARMAGLYANGDETIRIARRFGDLYVERVRGLSLRLRQIGTEVVIDDIMTFSEDFAVAEDAITVFGTEYSRIEGGKPAVANAEWDALLGEYGFEHNVLYISEKYGKLHALIEWGTEYPLQQLDANRFQFPAYGLYPNEVLAFERNARGVVRNASLNGIAFVRREIGKIDGEVFKIDPVRPVAELEREALAAEPPPEPGDFRDADLVDITAYSDTVKLDIRYASDRNFLGTPVYSSARAFLQRPAAEALARISKRLEAEGYGLLVHDAYRPWYVSKIFWDATPESSKQFVADPAQGSRHNRGSAIDLTLYDLATGETIEMVGLYDEFSQRSYPHYPGGTSLQRWHRELLRNAMEADGFAVYEYEWWHFDFGDWENYRILTDTFEALDN
jgi:CubicO group peptidase (beta-lactamase class C family)/D-alanyl-D-alanine dipeptidase